MATYNVVANGSVNVAGAVGNDTLVVDYSTATTAVTMNAPSLTGPVIVGYPAPGGTSFVSNGVNAANGARVVTYSGFDGSNYNSLWWGPGAIGAAMDGSVNSPQENLVLSSTFSNGGKTATWNGTTTIAAQYGNQVVYTKFVATLNTGEWHTANDIGMTGGPQAVADIDPASGFTVTYSFLASFDGVNFVPFNTLYNNTPRYVSGQAVTSLNGQFVYQDDGQSGSIADLSGNVANFSGIENFQITGGSADDKIATGSGDDVIDGGLGADKMTGGLGSDVYYVDNTGDKVIETGAGTDTVYSSATFDLDANVENLILTGNDAIFGSGNGLDNIITGNGKGNKLTGGAGNDQLSGGAGADRLIGGVGHDVLTGGAGGDWFVYKNVYDYSDEGVDNVDRITDFNKAQGDRIDLVNIDGNSVKGGYQRFDFIGTNAFSGKAGELRYEKGAAVSTIMIDTNGDGQSDLTIELDGSHTVTMDYFVI